MRLGELVGKEIVNIYNGARLGVVDESDMDIDIDTGEIRSIILPRKNNIINLWIDKPKLIIPWEAVRKIGAEVIIVELDQTNPAFQRYSY
ncbi:YlmC/YmxH family sporulation protein [Pelotomaculum terephthalicicum JT]|uniref:YlmC/YmxH family sporulation protein n=1 Tax=Pelotomaculum TaxID=191373 RepID=UPI0009D20EB7|nr:MULTISPECIES: YlmC/YmxH family sporulation protein [Pelotomaculum]MCG9967753.1 YlmC/YmxH family sporulation protein [Pelotomaculum terephthalicicum JT]OPX85371.1 MAG: PRC-barrel domain protein [Pelotomaculum sp. PtaB.Bin117]OPY62696.1 MAG: PRC-barrel domain protein [Pelotomaculum sp. PtaU1.Bin065]